MGIRGDGGEVLVIRCIECGDYLEIDPPGHICTDGDGSHGPTETVKCIPVADLDQARNRWEQEVRERLDRVPFKVADRFNYLAQHSSAPGAWRAASQEFNVMWDDMIRAIFGEAEPVKRHEAEAKLATLEAQRERDAAVLKGQMVLIQAVDDLFTYLMESGLVEEGGGLKLYEAMKPLADARSNLVALQHAQEQVEK